MIDAKEETKAEVAKDSQIKPIVDYLKDSKFSEDKNEARKLTLKASRYALVDEDLFRKSFFRPLLRCVTKEESHIVLKAIHSGVCGNHSKGRNLTHKVITVGCFWPYMMHDAQNYAKNM